MKHPLSTTALLISLFAVAQVIGIILLSMTTTGVHTENGQATVLHEATALGERPQTQGYESLIYLLIGITIGTALLLIMIKYRVFRLWKLWFLAAVWFSTTIAFGVFLPPIIALVICLALAVWKIFWPNPIIHNFTEIFMYAGLAVLLAPIFTLFWACVLLVIISIYDMIAVWYSKHMVVMAQAQTKSNLFAGLYVPKGKSLPAPAQPSGKKSSGVAILGGGDIAFPLIFSGVVLDWLFVNSVPHALALTFIITLTSTAALAALFMLAEKDKFYPAMPFLTTGVFAGLGIILLIVNFA